MRLVVSPRADNEMTATALWYEAKALGKGDEFIDAVESAYRSILEFPDAWPEVEPGVRRLRPVGFPCHVYYRRLEDRIEVRCCE